MSNQLFWEDTETGTEITPLPKIASTQMLIKWAAAVGDFNPLHYDDSFAAAQGVGKPIVHGQLKRAWLVQLLTDWIGDEGRLKTFSCQFRAVDYPRLAKTTTEPHDGETWWCKGKVTRTYVQDDEHLIDVDVWVENGKEEKTTLGSSTISLPTRG